jgi:hypothetical protein
MNTNDSIVGNSHDHIMANTWRLILERQLRPAPRRNLSQPVPDFIRLEELLSEYRLIGLSLAEKKDRFN